MKRELQNVLLLILSITISLFIIEIVVRQIDNEQFVKNNLYVISDYSTFIYKPNTHFNLKRPEFITDVKINSKGIRDYEYGYEKKENVRRIEMFGDSFIAAFQVPLEKSVSKKLEKLLSKNSGSNIQYDVLNMGLSGTGPMPQVIFLEKEGIKYDPDILISNIYLGNDFIKVDFGISGNIPIQIFEDNDDLMNAQFGVTQIQKIKNFVFRNFFTYSYIMKILNNLKNDESYGTDYPEVDIYKKQYTASTKEGLEKLKIILKHLKRYSDQKEIKLLIVLIPTKGQVDQEKFLEFVSKYEFDRSELELDKAQKIFLEFGKENNIKMLNLLPDFSKRNKNNTFYFFILNNSHWHSKYQRFYSNKTN